MLDIEIHGMEMHITTLLIFMEWNAYYNREKGFQKLPCQSCNRLSSSGKKVDGDRQERGKGLFQLEIKKGLLGNKIVYYIDRFLN